MNEDETVTDYHSRLIGIVHQMCRNGEKLDDVHVVEKMLRLLSPSFEHVVTAIEESKDLDTMSIEELLWCLRVHETHIHNNIEAAAVEQALKTKLVLDDRNGGLGRGRGRGRGRGGSSSRGRGLGYRDQLANLAESSDHLEEEPTLLVAGSEPLENGRVWYLDTGASNHMNGRKEFFMELHEGSYGIVSLGDGTKLAVIGKGKVVVFQKNGGTALISYVYYILTMRSNILSLGQLLEKRHVVHMEGNTLELRNSEGLLITHVQKT
ncbi:uncharacterized protein LOC120014160 [Tripterygium wilfordii]|uniref:uncharacterized protein LOC120014160 n=1 Tax=Tripterygium wilfordii TaxID=458696 RepID=UPI0018F81D64|nr:uncharacterized protein LOC120014160 [Tripterygium wilfordii]